MQQIVLELDPLLRQEIAEIKRMLASLARPECVGRERDDWMTAPEFLLKFRIGRDTLKRRVESGEVEVHDGHGRIKRYRWKQKGEQV